MAVKSLVNIGSFRFSKDAHPDLAQFAASIQRELDNMRRQINTQIAAASNSAQASTNTTVVVQSPSSESTTASGATKAGILAVTSVADTTVAFSGDAFSGTYVLVCYFLDSSGQFANIPVPSSMQTLSGFTVSASLLPSAGTLFYTATEIN